MAVRRRIGGVLAGFLLPALSTCHVPAGEGAPEVRPPAVAGGFYPGDRDALRRDVRLLLKLARKGPDAAPVALISPHAGYTYSGIAAAHGYACLKGRSYERVIVMGPSHYGAFGGASVPRERAYETPLGAIPIDRKAVEALERVSLVSHREAAERREHSIEVQLPFLQEMLGSFRLVPILIGDLAGDDAATLARAIAPLVDEHTLVVASSDFTHYGANYGYFPFPLGTDTPDRLRDLDFGAIRPILAMDRAGFEAYQARTGATICGRKPIAVLLELLRLRKGTPPGGRLLAYYRSGDTMLDYRSSVSYVSIGFFAGLKPGAGPLREGDLLDARRPIGRDEQAYLLRLARRSIARWVGGSRPRDLMGFVDPDAIPERVKARAGAFVTLKGRGRLRGCIGSIRPHWPLWKTVLVRAIDAAVRDTRFSPVRREELAEIEIEISVLTPPVKVPGPKAFVPGKHGIILQKGGRSAVYLPQVATEQGWDRETTLSHLARKAGLPPDAWREGATFRIFTAQVFSEEGLGIRGPEAGEKP